MALNAPTWLPRPNPFPPQVRKPIDVPPTPWKARWVGWDNPKFALHGRSGLAPWYPFVRDPLGFSMSVDLMAQLNPIARPPDAELDLLFQSEQLQNSSAGGVKSYLLAAFNHVPYGQPRVPDPADPNRPGPIISSLDVNVHTWHAVFRPNRWFNLISPITSDPGSGTWSIDNPILWAPFSTVIELANRMFTKHIMRSRWFYSLIFGRREQILASRWDQAFSDEFKAGTWTHDMPRKFGHDMNPLTPLTEAEYRQVERRTRELSEWIVWTFLDPRRPDLMGCNGWQDRLPYGLSVHDLYGTLTNTTGISCIQMSIAPILPLIVYDPVTHGAPTSLSPEELATQSYAILHIAITMVHELCHAMNYQTVRDNHAKDPTQPWLFNFEPFYRDETAAELGRSLEHEVFGGLIQSAPFAPANRANDTNLSGCYAMVMAPWPITRSVGKQGPWVHRDPLEEARQRGIDLVHPVPAIWAAVLHSQDYWDRYFDTCGSTSLKPPLYWVASQDVSHLPPKVSTARRTAFSANNSQLQRDYSEIVDRMDKVCLTWSYLRRDWYKQKIIWDKTPYAFIWFRDFVEEFQYAFQKRLVHEAADNITFLEYALYVERGFQVSPTLWIFYVLADLMRASLPWADHLVTVRTDPQRQVPCLWVPSNAAITQGTTIRFHGTFMAYGKPDTKIRLLGPGTVAGKLTPYDARQFFIHRARDTLVRSWSQWPAQRNVVQQLINAYFRVAKYLAEQPHDKNWFPFDFTFPPYDPTEWYTGIDLPFVGWTTQRYQMANPLDPTVPTFVMAPDPNAPVWAPAPETLMLPHSIAVWQIMQPPAGVRANRATLGGRPSAERYWTIAQVADEVADDEEWVLLASEHGLYELFVLPDDHPPHALQDSNLGLRAVTPAYADTMRRLHAGGRRGTLITPHDPISIAENNGQDGKPLWVTISSDVYDVTNFPASEKEAAALRRAGGRDISFANLDDDADIDTDELLASLVSYRCGTIRERPASPATHDVPRDVYTARQVRRYIYPNVLAGGLLCVIEGIVYDLRGCLDSHPGGQRVLVDSGGRDVTTEFHASHADSAELLKKCKHLVVGRIVQEWMPEHAISNDEIVLEHNVYRYTELQKYRETRDLYHQLTKYAGQDATEHFLTYDAGPRPEALLRLLEYPQLIVAKVTEPVTCSIYMEDLAEHRTLGLTADSTQPREASTGNPDIWCSIDDTVYDVTALALYAAPEVQERILRMAGGEITDPVLRESIRDRHVCPAIGRLVPGPRVPPISPEVAEEMRRATVEAAERLIHRAPSCLVFHGDPQDMDPTRASST